MFAVHPNVDEAALLLTCSALKSLEELRKRHCVVVFRHRNAEHSDVRSAIDTRWMPHDDKQRLVSNGAVGTPPAPECVCGEQ